ncbi:MAG: hypothetical protein ABJB12_24135 [Pseudomonadota bacterium]
MKTVFARAVVALSLVSLPASALAASKAKHHHHTDSSAPANGDAALAPKPTTKHHSSHKTAKNDKLQKSGEKPKALASSGHSHKAPVASKSIPAEPLH